MRQAGRQSGPHEGAHHGVSQSQREAPLQSTSLSAGLHRPGRHMLCPNALSRAAAAAAAAAAAGAAAAWLTICWVLSIRALVKSAP